MTLKSWAREPLVHFLLGGLVLWLMLAWQGEAPDPTSRSITVTQEDRARMALQWQRMMQRPPTDAELDSMTETWLREEILYREALRLGLDADDAVVRKRMANKMDFLASSIAETAQPSDDILQQWLADHSQRFAADTTYSFHQLYFVEKPAAMAALDSGDPATAGQSISLPADVKDMASASIEKRFGRAFLEGLQTLDSGQGWQGPIPSGFGWHLIRLEKRVIGTVPPLDDIREEVETDWRARTMEDRRDEAYQLLRDAYDVTITR